MLTISGVRDDHRCLLLKYSADMRSRSLCHHHHLFVHKTVT